MTNEMIKELAERMMNKVACEKICEDEFKDNKSHNPFYSERKGMEEMLKMMGIEFEYHFNDEVTEITGITIHGITVEA